MPKLGTSAKSAAVSSADDDDVPPPSTKNSQMKIGNHTGLGVVHSAVLQAPLEIVRSIVLYIPHYPDHFRLTTSVTIPKGSAKRVSPIAKAGAKYTIHRQDDKGRKISFDMSVTKLKDDYDKDQIMQTTFVVATKLWGCSSTSTCRLEAVNNDAIPSTRITMSYALAPETLWGHLFVRFRGRFYHKLGTFSLQSDIQDLERASVELHQERANK